MAYCRDGVFDSSKGESARAQADLLGPLFDAEPWADFATPAIRTGPAQLPTPPDTSSDSAEGPGLIRRVSNRLRRRFSSRAASRAEDRSQEEEKKKEDERKSDPPRPIQDKELPPLPFEAFQNDSPPSPPGTFYSSPVPPRRSSSLRSTASHALTEANLRIFTYATDREHAMSQYGSNAGSIRRSSSLRERYPNDPTVRPLAMLRQEHRAADRASHLHNRHRKQPSDTIDRLDISGGVPHHHEGPFDAASRARNVGKRNAPADALHESNLEALKATPRAFVLDSAHKHVPLQGTATIPPGHRDMSGNLMDYEEGVDMQRERHISGGPMGRWDVVDYLDADLKGKGEPSYTIEKREKEQRARLRRAPPSAHANGTLAYEMVGVNRSRSLKDNSTQVRTRRRSATEGSYRPEWDSPRSGVVTTVTSTSARPGEDGSSRSGGAIAAIKRRFGSLRRKKEDDAEYY